MLAGDDEADYIDGGLGDDSIKGMGGDDSLKGNGGGDDTLYGGDGDDMLDGGAGNDTLNGGAGDDELTGGSGNNTLDGGEGDGDIASYLEAMQATVDLRNGGKARVQHETPATGSGYISLEDSADSGTGNDTLTNIENVRGTPGDDTIDGDDKANELQGLDGADRINGNGGDDTIIPNRPLGDDNMPNVVNAEVDDPPEIDGVDTVDGGEGNDTISYEGESAAVTASLVPREDNVVDGPEDVDESETTLVTIEESTVVDSIATVEVPAEEEDEKATRVSTVENIIGGAGDDELTGDDRDNMLEGRAGGDMLNGGGGNDVLMGGGGVDTLNGGAGNDMLNGGEGDDADILNGGEGNDTIYAGVSGQTSNDVINAGEGPMSEAGPDNDPPAMDLGVDIVSFAMITEDTVDDVDGLGQEATATQGDQGVIAMIGAAWNAEEVHGSPLADDITGSDGRDVIMGGDGDDTLTAAGNDVTAQWRSFQQGSSGCSCRSGRR